MESILWALDLLAVAYLAMWALRTDKAEAKENKNKPRQDSNNA